MEKKGEKNILFKAYIRLDERKVDIQVKTSYHLVLLASQVGGLSRVVYFIFNQIVGMISRQIFFFNILGQLFLVYKKDSTNFSQYDLAKLQRARTNKKIRETDEL